MAFFNPKKLNYIFKSRFFQLVYIPLVLLLAAFFVVFNVEVAGVVVFAFIIALVLVFSDDLTDFLFPALILAVFVTRCYNSFSTFISLWWVAIFPALAFIYHLLANKAPLKIGFSFYGLVAVALAVMLGGVGTIALSDYLSSAFYILGLGVLMIGLYLLFKPRLKKLSRQKLAFYCYLSGLFACFCVFRFYLADLNSFLETFTLVEFQSSNNLATMLMIYFPFAFYFSTKNRLNLFSIPIIYVAIIFCGSRGGLIMGTIELFVLLTFYCIVTKGKTEKITCVALLVVATFLVILLLPDIFRFYKIDIGSSDGSTLFEKISSVFAKLIQSTEARYALIKRSFEDFAANPLFGRGLGYKGNSDLYSPVKGAMHWYHMWLPQIIGSLGLLGILAYGFQLVGRFILAFKHRSLLSYTFSLGYLGLFLMSQVNPGEFCPFPYCALGVLFFIAVENIKPKNKPKALAEPKAKGQPLSD